jgi:hypothetical protein
MAKPELVGHDAFYMKELNDMIDIKRDYDFWRARQYLTIVCIVKFLFFELIILFKIGKKISFIL